MFDLSPGSQIFQTIISDDLEKFRHLVTNGHIDFFFIFALYTNKNSKIGQCIRYTLTIDDRKQEYQPLLELIDEAADIIDVCWEQRNQLPKTELNKLSQFVKLILIVRNDLIKLNEFYQLEINERVIKTDERWYLQPELLAAHLGNVECFKLFQKYDPQVLKQVFGKYKTTVLYFAAETGKKELVEWLLDLNDADLRKPTSIGTSALTIAIDNGHYDVVLLLLKKGGDAMQNPTNDGTTPLITAVYAGMTSIVKLLLEQGNPQIRNPDPQHGSALHIAVKMGDLDIVKILVEFGGDAMLNCQNFEGGTPLHTAAESENVDIASLLLKKYGAAITTPGAGDFTALHVAARHGNLNMVKLLLAEGGEVMKQPAECNQTALHEAARNNHPAIVKELLEHGGKKMRLPNSYGVTALSLATKNGNREITEILIANGGDEMRLPDSTALNPLHYAVDSGHKDLVAFLIEKCPELVCQTVLTLAEKRYLEIAPMISGILIVSPAQLIANPTIRKTLNLIENYQAIVALLIKAMNVSAASVNSKQLDVAVELYQKVRSDICSVRPTASALFSETTGLNALHVAIIKKDEKTAEKLLEQGFDANTTTRDKSPATPLMLAIKHHPILVEILLRYKADSNAIGANGNTALSLAAKHKNLVVTRLLLENNCNLTAAILIEKEITDFILPQVYNQINFKSAELSENHNRWLKELIQCIHFDNIGWFEKNKLQACSPLKNGLSQTLFLKFYFEILFAKLGVLLQWRQTSANKYEITGADAKTLTVVYDIFQNTIKFELKKQISKILFNLNLSGGNTILKLEFSDSSLRVFVNYIADKNRVGIFQEKIKPQTASSSHTISGFLIGGVTRALNTDEINIFTHYARKIAFSGDITFSNDNSLSALISYETGYSSQKKRYEFQSEKTTWSFSEKQLESIITRLRKLNCFVEYMPGSHTINIIFDCKTNLESQAWKSTLFEFIQDDIERKSGKKLPQSIASTSTRSFWSEVNNSHDDTYTLVTDKIERPTQ